MSWKRPKKKQLDILRCDVSPSGDAIRTKQDWDEHRARVRAHRDERIRKWQERKDLKDARRKEQA